MDPMTISGYVLSAIGTAAVIAAALPPVGPPWWLAIRNVIVVLGANVGYAKNAAPPPPLPTTVAQTKSK